MFQKEFFLLDKILKMHHKHQKLLMLIILPLFQLTKNRGLWQPKNENVQSEVCNC